MRPGCRTIYLICSVQRLAKITKIGALSRTKEVYLTHTAVNCLGGRMRGPEESRCISNGNQGDFRIGAEMYVKLFGKQESVHSCLQTLLPRQRVSIVPHRIVHCVSSVILDRKV